MRLLATAAAPARAAAHVVLETGRELAELSLHGPRARYCLMASLIVTLSVAVTSLAHLPDLWWAGVSGFMSLQATNPASFRKVVLRVVGTVTGAVLAALLLPIIVYDHVAFGLTLWAVATLGILGFMVSPHGYAWLFFAITFILVALISMDEPLTVLDNAVYRTVEVTIGSSAALVVTWLLAPDEASGTPAPPSPGWTGLLGAQFPLVLYALRGGVAVMVTPLLWRWLELPSLVQMPVTVVAVMAVPVAIADPERRSSVIADRALQRLIGCFLGGLGGLLFLALSPENFPAWLALLAAGIWVASHVQASTRGVGYVGTQGAIAFILTSVQGAGPPTSIIPGVDRFFGVTLGLAALLSLTVLLDFLFAPAQPAAPGPPLPTGA